MEDKLTIMLTLRFGGRSQDEVNTITLFTLLP